MKNKVIVTIAGREYALTAAEDDGYVQRVAAFVDEQIHQVSQETHAAAIDAAVMAAMTSPTPTSRSRPPLRTSAPSSRAIPTRSPPPKTRSPSSNGRSSPPAGKSDSDPDCFGGNPSMIELLLPPAPLRRSPPPCRAEPLRSISAPGIQRPANAANFGGDALDQAVEYCHLRGKGLPHGEHPADRRRADRRRCPVDRARAIGVDALLVQDLGVARMARRWRPTCRCTPPPR